LHELFFTGSLGGAASAFFFTEGVVLLCGALADVFVEGFFARLTGVCACMGNAAAIPSSITRIEMGAIEMTRKRKHAPSPAAIRALMAQNRGGIRIRTQRFWIATGQDLHHPVIEIIHWMGLYSLEPAIVFFMGLLNVVTQSGAQIAILAPSSHVFRAQQLYILHRNLGYPIGAPMQFLLIGGQRSQAKCRLLGFGQLDFKRWLDRNRLFPLRYRFVHKTGTGSPRGAAIDGGISNRASSGNCGTSAGGAAHRLSPIGFGNLGSAGGASAGRGSAALPT